ncbi:HEAT repeat domain-containing protein [Streptomyces sp. OR43]|uniref:HEAT repeat domain-containing protein n=1 Tax=Streptomyces sp. or43 TaxID=2478957 RepID=UPI003966AD76
MPVMCSRGFRPRPPATRHLPPCCGPAPAIWGTTRTPSRRGSVHSRRETRRRARILLPCAVGNDEDLRRAAIRLLGFVPEPGDLYLLATLRRTRTRESAARSWARSAATGQSRRPSTCCLNLLDDPRPQVRVCALSSLGFLQQPRTLPKVRLLANDGNPRVRASVAIAMGRSPAPQPADPATSAVPGQLAADADPYVCDQAAEARQRKHLRSQRSQQPGWGRIAYRSRLVT